MSAPDLHPGDRIHINGWARGTPVGGDNRWLRMGHLLWVAAALVNPKGAG